MLSGDHDLSKCSNRGSALIHVMPPEYYLFKTTHIFEPYFHYFLFYSLRNGFTLINREIGDLLDHNAQMI